MPGEGGSTLYVDSDGVIDTSVTDRYGKSWYSYRARQAEYTIPKPGPGHPRPISGFPYPSEPRQVGPEFANTGLLRPVNLPGSDFMEFSRWHTSVLEPDFLMGRRGVAGWNGKPYDVGLWLPGLAYREADWKRPWPEAAPSLNWVGCRAARAVPAAAGGSNAIT